MTTESEKMDEPTGKSPRRPSDAEIQAAVPRERGGREVKVGIFVIVGILSAIAVLFVLTDPATLRGRYILVTQLENAGGIRRADPVQMRGVNIGRIHGFDMRGSVVNITLEIEGQWQIPRDSHTRLTGQGLFGGRTMEIIPGETQEPARDWDTIPSLGGAGGFMESAENLGTQATGVLEQLGQLFAEPTVANVRASTAELQALIAELRLIAGIQRQQLGQLTASLNRTAAGLETASGAAPDVARAAARADSVLAQLNRTSATLDVAASALGELLSRVERGEGTLGRLTSDEALYENVNRAAEAIALLATDIRENPGRYVRIEIF